MVLNFVLACFNLVVAAISYDKGNFDVFGFNCGVAGFCFGFFLYELLERRKL